MNERIKELKKQAWDYAMAVHDGHIVPPLDKEVWPIDKVLDEKFAELIVRECLKFVEPDQTSGDEWCVTLDETAQSIRQHFGVEE
jgi:hypothetical protein